MELNWKLTSSRTRGTLRVVRWAARIDGAGDAAMRWLYMEKVYELGTGGLLADEDEEAKRLMQVRYGTESDRCVHATPDEALHQQERLLC